MVEPEKHMKKKELIRLDEEIASKLQAKFDEEVKLTREKAEKEQEANVALTEEWDDIQAKIKVDHELAQRLRKHFAAKRAEDKRNKPPTQAQQRKIMCTYLNNMEGKKPKDLKNKSLNSNQKMFDRAFKRVSTFIDFRIDLVEGSSKRAGEELEQENVKKQKVDDNKETAKLKSLMNSWPEVKKSVTDEYSLAFDREDLETLYKLVKAKYGSTRPVEDLDLVLYGDLKTMFEPHVEDNLFHLNDSDIFDFIVALRMFTRSLVIKCQSEDLRLGVESYQKKLNITAPQKTFPEIEFKELYTPSYKPPGVIYEDLNKQNKRVIRADELYKFSDGILKKV
ncbi:hypothetical protein Tco_0836713 [Tanacetum coccineum]